MFIAATISSLVVLALLIGTSPFVFSKWADGNFIFTKIKEGQGKIVVKGDSFHSALLSFSGYHLNAPGLPGYTDRIPDWEIVKNGEGQKDERYDSRNILLRNFGLYWVGIPGMRKIRRYRFSWNEYREENSGESKLWHRNEETEVYIANDFPYVMALEDGITKDNLPVHAEFVIIVRITNPKKALFGSNDWRVQLESYVDRQGRNFIGSFGYDQLRSETDEDGLEQKKKENFSLPIMNLTTNLGIMEGKEESPGTKEVLGIEIRGANLESIRLSGPAALENERLSTARYAAERNAETTRINAAALADAKKMDGDAQAHVIEKTSEATALGLKKVQDAQAQQPWLAAVQMIADAIAGRNRPPV